MISAFSHSVCLLVCGWYAVEGFMAMSSILYSSRMNSATNWVPLSLMTFLGRPNRENTLSRSISATPLADSSVVVGIARTILEKRSTTVRIASYPFEAGKGPIMSIEMISHGASGASWGCNGAAVGPCLGLVF